MSALPGSSGVLISLARPPNLPPDVGFVPVERFDYAQYSMFIVHCLHYHIHTEFALIVQDDGWALSGDNWRDEWFDFDYVGAPAHTAGVNGRLYHLYSWVGLPNPAQVFNGGFSLRSRRFLEAPTRYGVCYKMMPESVLRNEDVQLCILLREALERRGLKFAPAESALHFSMEFMHPVIHRNLDLKKLFGHHAHTRKLRANSTVNLDLTTAEVQSIFGESQFLELLTSYGYTVKCKDDFR
jgi:hypothetical protein